MVIMAEKRKKKAKGITFKAKKKMAVARAKISKGTGRIRINRRDVDTVTPEYMQDFIREPMEIAGALGKEVNVDVSVHGGGFMGQTVSARSAIAKALVDFRKDEKLKQNLLAYDRMLLVDDARRVESKKQLGPKARRKKQASKR